MYIRGPLMYDIYYILPLYPYLPSLFVIKDLTYTPLIAHPSPSSFFYEIRIFDQPHIHSHPHRYTPTPVSYFHPHSATRCTERRSSNASSALRTVKDIYIYIPGRWGWRLQYIVRELEREAHTDIDTRGAATTGIRVSLSLGKYGAQLAFGGETDFRREESEEETLDVCIGEDRTRY